MHSQASTWPLEYPPSHLYMGTFKYRRAVTPDTTYSHQKAVKGMTWQERVGTLVHTA